MSDIKVAVLLLFRKSHIDSFIHGIFPPEIHAFPFQSRSVEILKYFYKVVTVIEETEESEPFLVVSS